MKKLPLILLCIPYLLCSQSVNTGTSLTIIECDSFLRLIDTATFTNSGLYINIDSSGCNPSFVSNYNFLYNGSSNVAYNGQVARLEKGASGNQVVRPLVSVSTNFNITREHIKHYIFLKVTAAS